MNTWLLLGGIALTGVGFLILLNRERVLRSSQKHLRRGAGQLGELIAERAKPSDMIGPGIGAIFIGGSWVFQSVTYSLATAEASGSSTREVEGLDIFPLLLGIVFIAWGVYLLRDRKRAVRRSRENLPLNVGHLGEGFGEAVKPSRMIVPAIATILSGVWLVVVAITEVFIA